ncbi:N-acetylmuramoyl-L-alanine amidase [Fibrobacter sp. UWB2]|uniref:N-acetylmuramoyl-L-alanine amidase family protein n=1 Tax=Fibrobacter sp. UWB2 TaxID=1964358 RepID=UPI000B527FCC|nr:N-acetylmuramoyl-L-alanine amidase [Fibrobacter sp. UWB2]OWV24743.1 N-acetylmuramoyl-L-alanine amidase [Fibrobacter sp. UWB2]
MALAATARVDVESVAREIKGSFHWYPVQKTFSIVSAKDTLKFAVGIPYMTRNGRTIDLSAAPELDNGHLWIAENDAKKISNKIEAAKPVAKPAEQKPAQPVVVKPKAPKQEIAGTREVRTIVIDPGHGGKDPGASGKKSQEKDIVLAVAKLLRKNLADEGFNVKLTRSKDVFIELRQRANLANQWDGDLFISLHCNAIDASEERKKIIQGYQFYVLRAPESEEDKAIARRENAVATLYGEKNAKDELSPLEWFKLEARLEQYKQTSYLFTEKLLDSFDGGKIKKMNTGVGGAGFMVLVGAMMPAVLIELGFISNEEDEAYMMTKAGQQDLADRIAQAVSKYKDAVHTYRETLGR